MEKIWSNQRQHCRLDYLPDWILEVLYPEADRLIDQQLVTPAQWYARDRHLTGEEKLLQKILVEAILEFQATWGSGVDTVYQLYSRKGRLARRAELEEWFASTSKGSITDFESICDYFEMDVDKAREKLRELAARLDAGGKPITLSTV